MNDYIIYLALLFIGLCLFALGIYNYKRFFNRKEIISFYPDQNSQIINFEKNGKYSIVLAGSITMPFTLSITSDLNSNIDLYEPGIKYKVFVNGKICVTYYNFTILKAGKYILAIKNKDSLLHRDAMRANLYLTVKEFSSPYNYIGMLLSFILGTMVVLTDLFYLLSELKIIATTP